MIKMLKESLSKNRSVRFVKIRSKRNCSHCGKIQQEGCRIRAWKATNKICSKRRKME